MNSINLPWKKLGAAAVLQGVLFVALIYTQNITFSNSDTGYFAMLVLTFALLPYSICAVFFRGFNARSWLLICGVCMVVEFLTFRNVQYYAAEADAYFWRTTSMLLSYLITLPIYFARVRIMMAFARVMYRFKSTKKAAISIMTQAHYTRLDTYMFYVTSIHLTAIMGYYAFRYYFFFGFGGDWTSYEEYVALMINAGGHSVHQWFEHLTDVGMTLHVLAFLYTCLREKQHPDMLSLAERKR